MWNVCAVFFPRCHFEENTAAHYVFDENEMRKAIVGGIGGNEWGVIADNLVQNFIGLFNQA